MAEIGYNGPMHKEEEGLGYGVFNAPEFKDLQKRVDALEEGGGAEQIQSDWNQTNSSAVDFIKNKPTIPEEYELPIASDAVLGGIKVGDNLTIDEDGTLNATGGSGGGGADWAAAEGEDGFIENKPFDVASSSQREIFDNTINYSSEESSVAGYVYNGTDDVPELSPSDVGKTVVVTVNGREMTATLMQQTEFTELFYAIKDYDVENEQFTSNLGFMLQIIDNTEISMNSILCCIPDEVVDGVDCTIELSGTELSKLSASKISIGNGLKNSNGSIALSDSVAALLNKLTPIYTGTSLNASDDGTPLEANITIIGDMFNVEFETHRSSINDVTYTCDVELDVDVDLDGGIPVNVYYKDEYIEYTVKAYIDGNRFVCTVHIVSATQGASYFYTPMLSSFNW